MFKIGLIEIDVSLARYDKTIGQSDALAIIAIKHPKKPNDTKQRYAYNEYQRSFDKKKNDFVKDEKRTRKRVESRSLFIISACA